MLVFKQGITKYVKRRSVLMSIAIPIAFGCFSIIGLFLSRLNWNQSLEFFLVCNAIFLPFSILMAFGAITTLEWFCIYEDRIEARGVLGCKNIVYYKDVEYVEERMLPLNIKDCVSPHYIFHDGRKNSGGILEHISSPNKKKYTLRIYKTPALENYILNTLHLEIRKTKTQWDALSE